MSSMDISPAEPAPSVPNGPARTLVAMPDAESELVAQALPATPNRSDVAMRDWDALLHAVEARLRYSAGELPSNPLDVVQRGVGHRVRAGVLECVAALDQLHTTLTHELGRRQRLELEVFDAQTALAKAHAELADIRSGRLKVRATHLRNGSSPIPDHRAFEECMDNAFAVAAPQWETFALLYLNLDGFKTVNEQHGRAVGDEVLGIVASRLARTVRTFDMVSRLPGDEFACLISGLPNRVQLIHLACKLFDAIGARTKVGQLSLNVYASIGIAIHPADGTNGAALLASAEAAMHRAKRQSTGYAFFDDPADVNVNGRALA